MSAPPPGVPPHCVHSERRTSTRWFETTDRGAWHLTEVHLHPVHLRKRSDASDCRRVSYGTQGDIESVAQMTPRQLTELFEKVSGSGLLKKDYDERQVPPVLLLLTY